MATYNSDNLTANASSDRTGAGHGIANNAKQYRFAVTVDTSLDTTDTINFGYVPKGFRLTDAVLACTDLDTGGPTITINVGDSGSGTRLFSAATAAQAGLPSRMTLLTGIGYQYTAQTLVTGALQANATTPAAGTITLILTGIIEATAS